MKTRIELCVGLWLGVALFGALAATGRAQGYPGHWHARWIWDEGAPAPYDYFLMARRTIALDDVPVSANLKITASDRYMLYVNGEYLGRGPARSDPRFMSFDTYDIAKHLIRGQNSLAVLAYHYGAASNYTRDARAGLFVQAELGRADGSQLIVGTDERWRVRHAQGWNQDVRMIRFSTGMNEVFDATADPAGWMARLFDDSQWESAHVIPQRETPWSYLEARQTPMMREVEIFPAKLTAVGEVMDPPESAFKETDVPERLLAGVHYPLQYAKISDAQAVLKPGGRAAVMQSSPYVNGDGPDKGGRSPYLLVDFGRPVFGFPKLQLEGQQGAVVEITYGPDLVAGRVLPIYQGVRNGDRYTLRSGKQTWQLFEYKQFRYLEIVVRNAAKPVTMDSVSLISYEYPAERSGAFECSDPVLTKLWKAGVDTTYLSMEDALVCDAVRERRVWTGDGAHGLYAIYAAFGDVAITDWFFRLISRGQLPDGMLRMFYPGTDLGAVGMPRSVGPAALENPWNIPQFALFYGILAGEHYEYFGKRKLMEELYPVLVRLAGWCERQADENGLLYNLPNWNFTDWVKNEMNGANLETNALYYKVLQEMTVMAKDLGQPKDAEKWGARADLLRETIRRLYWNPQKELYADSVIDGKQSPVVTELSNGMALFFGVATPEQQPKIVRQLTSSNPQLVRSTPLYYYYVVEGLMQAGAADAALRQMRDRYAPMIETSDFPTIWEAWPNQQVNTGFGPNSSHVHSGGVGSTWTLSKHVLGVQPDGPGFQRCRIEPQTGNLEWAKGVFPSIRGEIAVSWNKGQNRFVLDVRLPENLETAVVLPRDPRRNLELNYDGKRSAIPAGAKSAADLQLSGETVVVTVRGGSHHFEAVSK